MTPNNSPLKERISDLWDSQREELLQTKIRELGLKLEGSRLQPLVSKLYDEMERAGIKTKPKVYLGEEWGCPDAVPIIGVPFYLADERLSRIEDETMDGIEAESDQEILRYLRHEAGHAVNYAFKLYESQEWLDMFGPYSRPYNDDYTPNPFSRNFVRHLPGWYAQKHPDEDFAETFAVWLTPESNWREVYKNWGCYEKLLYVDRLMKELGQTDPLVSAEGFDYEEELNYTLGEYYEKFRSPLVEVPAYFDGDLRDIFENTPKPDTHNMRADHFLGKHKKEIVWHIAYWTGVNDSLVRSLLSHFIERCKELRLFIDLNEKDEVLMEMIAYSTTLCMNKLYKGEFVLK